MKKYPDYKYPEKIPIRNRQWPDREITKAPIWCSVDLRDGNQALPIPMNPDQKLRYFDMLCKIGFKEIEVAFPSASKDDFDFVRSLIEKDKIPEDVRISILTQARKHLIEKSIESLIGSRKATFHCYVATSDLHSKIVFEKERKEVIKMAEDGTRFALEGLIDAKIRDHVCYEFSPEEFTDSDIDFVIELCEKVYEIWRPKFKGDLIFNLPATVERRPPNHYADMIEYFCTNYKYRDEVLISLHAHNDQGCAVAASELALAAGADRVEGTLLGHGERTGNLDIITFALNLHARGIKTGLDFSKLPDVIREVEDISGIDVHPRHPYAGDLVFTAFSGSHQDAIRKGMLSRDKAAKLFNVGWKVPYLHINPLDIGKKYEHLIRINSQSGKGGIAYILENDFGISVPKSMHPELGAHVQKYADKKGSEITASEIKKIFDDNFVTVEGPFEFLNFAAASSADTHFPGNTEIELNILKGGKTYSIKGIGNGPISAAVHALQSSGLTETFTLDQYHEQAIDRGEDARAMAFISLKRLSDGKIFNGAGIDYSIDIAPIKAIVSALNKAQGK
ncbi:MAG TPA: 2-isopropylmalate synthase [Lentisphaeria bacterium]|nr:MAG: 2-isopropylmalate synthase [Lentisphaerae bacterium GWF2_38_69]HBM16397.1 2-isopropylmalate synthase [Lentisphaeria bacterium]